MDCPKPAAERPLQDIPINISSVSAQKIARLRLTGISKIARYVPGLAVIDRGPRDEVPDILVRGLNTLQLGPGFTSNTVTTYFGDIPIPLDVNPVDLERVEVLIGPQGTLYGQGTMGGAIRYIPMRADPEAFSADVRGTLSQQNFESDDLYIEAFMSTPPIVLCDPLRRHLQSSGDDGGIENVTAVHVTTVAVSQHIAKVLDLTEAVDRHMAGQHTLHQCGSGARHANHEQRLATTARHPGAAYALPDAGTRAAQLRGAPAAVP